MIYLRTGLVYVNYHKHICFVKIVLITQLVRLDTMKTSCFIVHKLTHSGLFKSYGLDIILTKIQGFVLLRAILNNYINFPYGVMNMVICFSCQGRSDFTLTSLTNGHLPVFYYNELPAICKL